MALLNVIRNRVFWTLDFLKGSPIHTHLRDIETILNSPASTTSEEYRNLHLRNLLDHATKSTPYYQAYFNYKSLEDFPVIQKTIIQHNFESFRASNYKEKASFKVATSGSTGVPFFLFQDKNKRFRNTADVIYFSKLSNYNIGNRLYNLEVWRKHNQKSSIQSYLQNIIQLDITRLDDQNCELFLNRLQRDKQTKTILGFASALEIICQYLERSQKKHIPPKKLTSIIANAEHLNSFTKSQLHTYFDVPILSRYSNEELGIIAQQTIESPDHYIINHASYFIEILDLDTDETVAPGHPGRIVVTDLFNYCMPIIRYDTGDIGQLNKHENGVTKLEYIEGRKMDLIHDTSGQIISSFIVYTKFYKYYSYFKQFQFIQEAKNKYTVKLNIHDNFPYEEDLIADIKQDFGHDAEVEIHYVDEIPTLSSGKRKKVLNNIMKY
ncbi:CoF synthetase [Mangrovimonas sp. YM274]|uniref:CoF synthetase n=1 Tax=Mangrovimonas sp. YM274 TaxID=3070660 RepID=UPI0027DDD769|nr:CoF synthetase [Mangrovimonas sp. YM274]WMI67653.1 CoF synthetase [Mangrovimonas sp. YM274]